MFLAITFQSGFAQQPSTTPPSTDIEIVPDNGGTPTPVPPSPTAQGYKPNTDSYNPAPFSNPTDPDSGGPPSNYAPPPTLAPTTLPNPSPGPSGVATPKEGVPTPVMVRPTKTAAPGVGQNFFDFKGILWNGCEYVAIITSKTDPQKSYIAKTGDKLEEGYKVLFLSDKELIVVKDGVKSTLKLQQEVEK